MRARVDVPAEQVHGSDFEAADTPGDLEVVQHERVQHNTQSEGGDGEIDTSRAQGGRPDDEAQKNCGHDTDNARRNEGHIVDRHQPCRGKRAGGANEELGQRELTRVAGDHDDRQAHHRERDRHSQRDGPLVGERTHDGAAKGERDEHAHGPNGYGAVCPYRARRAPR